MTAQVQSEVAAGLREAGEQVQYRAAIVGGNPSDAPVTPPDAVELWARVESYTSRELANTSIRGSDKKVMLEAGQVVPKAGDTLTIRGSRHKIERVGETNLAGVPVMYECQCREG